MLRIYPYDSLGQGNFGWLTARYHFSFSRYVNRTRQNFGVLRVINDDIVAAGHGFDPHSHSNMEIITYVKRGAITHEDNLGNRGRIEAGSIQVMSAGTGIMHSEYNHESEDTALYQIWIEPNKMDIEPRWNEARINSLTLGDSLTLLASGQAEHQSLGVLYINQDAAIFGAKLPKGTQLTQRIKHQAYILTQTGNITIDGQAMHAGDGAELTGVKSMEIVSLEEGAEIIIIDVPEI